MPTKNEHGDQSDGTSGKWDLTATYDKQLKGMLKELERLRAGHFGKGALKGAHDLKQATAAIIFSQQAAVQAQAAAESAMATAERAKAVFEEASSVTDHTKQTLDKTVKAVMAASQAAKGGAEQASTPAPAANGEGTRPNGYVSRRTRRRLVEAQGKSGG